MSMPPKDLSPDELWTKMQEIPRPSEIVDFPRYDPGSGKTLTRIRIQVLTLEDHINARMAARAKVMEQHKVTAVELDSLVLREVVSDYCAREALKLACLGVNPINETDKVPRYPLMFATDQRLATLSVDETNILFNSYTLVQEKYGPYSDNDLSEEEYNAWIRVLTEGGKIHFLARKNLPQLAELCTGLASRAYLLSLIVESLLKDSQSITASQVAKLGIGTSWFTGLLLNSTEESLTLSARVVNQIGEGAETLDEVIADWLHTPAVGEAITIEQAIAFTKRMQEEKQ